MSLHVPLHELTGIDPSDIVTYLTAAGWRDAGRWRRSTVWNRTSGGEEFEALVPDSPDLRDYPARVADVLEAIAQAEGRTTGAVLHDVRSLLVDVQNVRTEPASPSGSIPLRQGVQAVKGIRDLFAAAASTATLDDPTAVLPSTMPRDVWRFLDHVRLGESQRGSYIMRVETQLGPTTDGLALPPRVVLDQLYRAAEGARQAAVESVRSRDSRVFEEVVGSGVSADLCEALVAISGGDGIPFELNFAWAPARPLGRSTPDLRFDRSLLPALREGGRHLRATIRAGTTTATGRVTRLERGGGGRGGQVMILGLLELEGREIPGQSISVSLSPVQYQDAIRAHADNLIVVAVGHLARVGHQQALDNVRRFEVLA
ncbi:hypothetical protein AB0I60_28935 [Actinosynnema sp. NPDC050436]|uniref:hypothetical protein n=1 Tax=Actinosynnema sp. NPDC050436 TaxID=3155659 RepID=UPI0033FFE446